MANGALSSSVKGEEDPQQSFSEILSPEQPVIHKSPDQRRRRSKNKSFLHFNIRSHSMSQLPQDLDHLSLSHSTTSEFKPQSRVLSTNTEPGLSVFSNRKRHSILNLRRKKHEDIDQRTQELAGDDHRLKFGSRFFKKQSKSVPIVPEVPITPTASIILTELKKHNEVSPNPLRLQFEAPLIRIDENSTPRESMVRPAYHRSISFQSKSENDGRSILSHVSSKSSSSEAEKTMNPDENSEMGTLQDSPKRLRQRSKTTGALDYTKVKNGDFAHISVPDFSSPVSNGPYGGFGNTQLQAPKPVSRYSILANFVKTRRSSSILALDEIGKMSELQPTPGSSTSEKTDFIHGVNGSHNTLATGSSTSDYFTHRSRLSPSIGHRSTNSTTSIEKSLLSSAEEDESAKAYINRLITSNRTTEILPLISQKESEFNSECLDYFVKFFDFSNEPLDVSLRKFLMFNELPKETQQIDRVLYRFSKEYCLQNPLTSFSEDLCFILAFSLLILHTDHFNPNNKRKMTKLQFVRIVKESLQNYLDKAPEQEKDNVEFMVKNAITRDILGYYFDNITFLAIKRIDECSKEQLLKANHNKGSSLLNVDSESIMSITDTEVDPHASKASLKANISTTSIAPVQRRRQSSFFLPASAGSEGIYDYLLGLKDIDELRFHYDFQKSNPFISVLNGSKTENAKLPYTSGEDNILSDTEDRIDEIDPKIFLKLMNNLVSSEPEILLRLKPQRASLIRDNCKVQIVGSYEDGSDTFFTRVFKMGTVYRQELKMLTSSTSWKPYFAVLTSVGLIFFKDISCLKFNTTGYSNNQKVTILDEQLSTGFFDTSTDTGFMIYIHGLFANRSESGVTKKSSNQLSSQLESFKFTIYGKNSRDTYSVTDEVEFIEWMFNINYLVAIRDCYLVPEPQTIDLYEPKTFSEIRHSTSMSLLQKVNKSNKVLTASLDLLKKLFGVCNNFELLMPFNTKTRELSTYSAQLLSTRISWCWYELNKNLVIVKVLLYAINEQEGVDNNDDQINLVTKDPTYDNTFISLHREKTVASVLLVIDYNINSSMHLRSTDHLTLETSDSESFETLFYDCDE